MLLFDGFAGVIAFAVWIFCIIDAVTTPRDRVRTLPKLLWIMIVIVLPPIGSIAWLVLGRSWGPKGAGATAWGSTTRSGGRPSNPDDDDEFLAGLQARAEEQRRRAREIRGEEPQGGTGTTS